MIKFLLHLLLPILGLCGSAAATSRFAPGPVVATPSLSDALNPDGTLKLGITGSFDARTFRMCTAPDGRPVFRPVGAAGAGDERWQAGFGISNGADGPVYSVVQSGTNLFIGGAFTAVGTVLASNVARWNGTTWSALGTGVNGFISTLAIGKNGELYAGGSFSQAGRVPARNMAKWNGTGWSQVGTGLRGPVNALAVASNGDVYAGGYIIQSGGYHAGYVVKWNGTTLSNLGTGIITVTTLVVASNGDVYVGGNFAQISGVAADNVARWNGTTWSALGTGVNGSVSAVAVAGNGDVYVCGNFTQAGGVPALNVAKWNSTSWSALGAGVSGIVNVLAVASNGDVYVGGLAILPTGVLRWNGATWSSLGTIASSLKTAVTNVLVLIVASNGDVYVGGDFAQLDGVAANCVARWNGTAWNGLNMGVSNGIGSPVHTVAVASNGEVYAGGSFTVAGGIIANNVAKWNGTTWSPLGTGVDGTVYALAVASNGDVYAGGVFTRAGGTAANYVAKWDGMAWNALGTGTANGVATANGLNTVILALVVASNGDVYAGGVFTQAGGVAANYVARWNGTAWSPLGTGAANGVDDYTEVLALNDNGELYVGGDFTQAGGVAASRVAKWNGTTWSSLGTGAANGLNGSIIALAVSGSNVYVSGYFYQAGGVAANNVAKWNGTTWSALGTGVNDPVSVSVSALAIGNNGDLYAGGRFSQAGGVPARYVAHWNGTAWSALGTGLNAPVHALAKGANGSLYVGGEFTTTGDGSKVIVGFGIYDSNAPLATTAATSATPAALFPHPAHGTATLRLPVGAPRQPLILTDALGRVVRHYPAPAGPDTELDLRGLPAGTYLVHCGQFTQRLVVE